MKTIAIIFFTMAFIGLKAQIQEISLRNDNNITKALDQFIENTSDVPPEGLGVIALRFTGVGEIKNGTKELGSLTFYATYVIDRRYIYENPPSYYYFHKSYPVIMYTGVEELINYSNKSLEKTIKIIENNLKKMDEGVYLISPIWKIDIAGSEIDIAELR